MELSFRTRTVADWTVLQVAGEVDLATRDELRERLLALVAEGARHLVVDLSALEFIDSSGLGVLIRVRNVMQEQGGSLTLVANQERILKPFRVTGLADNYFTIVASVEAAVSAGDGTEPAGGADGPAAAGDAGADPESAGGSDPAGR
jgi:anti-sigma B factor antagonist